VVENNSLSDITSVVENSATQRLQIAKWQKRSALQILVHNFNGINKKRQPLETYMNRLLCRTQNHFDFA